MALQDFINQYNGQHNVGDTDPNRGECVGVVEVWLDLIGSPHIWGNACDLPANADGNAYAVTANSFEYVPAAGDIGCLPAGWGGSSVGHTFIVAPGTTQQTLVVFEQNNRIGGGDGACRVSDAIGWPDGLVFIHPRVLDPAPVSVPAPVVVPEPAPVVPAPVVETPPVAPVPVPPTPSNPPLPTPVVVPGQIVLPSVTPDLTPPAPDTIILNEVKPMNKLNLHTVLAVATYVVTLLAAVVGYFNSTETVSLLGLVTVVVGVIEHTKLKIGN